MDDHARMMEKVTRVGDLYDFYGVLLTERQRQMVELSYLDDWSLAEIASHFDVSRQAVHDSLHRAVQQLETFEASLHLLESHRRQREQVQRLTVAWQQVEGAVPEAVREELRACITALAKEFQMEAG
ncbi:YlxM family DNA-binding protein [Alicyclobacillus sp. ALC3]|uniref:YlxM family DNA-binding protein n=1 Tax=Alicyclobacillus sp. ALC3 TaxID=2796143 RepID=UPI002379B317|nr:YlxM family DNA-binding protein [Alicyclobacillus sp. ALC3]